MHLALRQFRPLLLGKHVLVRTDNTAAVSYINWFGGIRSHRMSQLARHLLFWSHMQSKSLYAVHIPEKLQSCSRRTLTTAYVPRRNGDSIPRWSGLIWSRLGEAQVNLFASHDSLPPPAVFFPDRGPLCTDALAHSGPQDFTQVCVSPSETYSHRQCASSGRTRSRSCWLCCFGPPGDLGFPN